MHDLCAHKHKRTHTNARTYTHATDLRTAGIVKGPGSTFDGSAAEVRIAEVQHRVHTQKGTYI